MKNIFEGQVIHGQKEGRTLGYPTANIEFRGRLDDGIYAGWAIVEGKKYKAGLLHKRGTNILEAYIIDFSGDLYGKVIELEVRQKIREDIKFNSNEELIEQVKKDIEKIKELL
jgi:riboflavin kinase/FMN adenylyltransferase